MFVKYGTEYAELIRILGKSDLAELAKSEVEKVYNAVIKAGWDGEWFKRAYDAYVITSYSIHYTKLYEEHNNA